jgi:hypothetical protein
MTPVLRVPVHDASAWDAAALGADPSWRVALTTAHLREIDAAMAGVAARGLRAAEFARDDFPLPTLAAMLDGIARELRDGRGVVLLTGLPVERLGVEGSSTLLWGLGTHMGQALRQRASVNLGNVRDGLIGHVTDLGYDYGAPNVAGSTTSAEQAPHSDPADVVALLCVRPAREGGISRIVSSTAVYNVLLAEHPEILTTLYRGFRNDLRDEARDSAVTEQRMPVYSWFGDRLSCIFNSKTIEQAQAKLGLKFSDDERDALDAVLETARRPALEVEMTLAPGELQLLNNYTVLHSRTAWVDEDAARKRLMLRLWLKLADFRPLAPGFVGGYTAGSRIDVATAYA